MNCPVCENERLVMTERQGIEIDYCPKCRGVWLDRGELDKIIEKSMPSQQQGNQNTFLSNSADSSLFSRGNGHHGYHGHDKDYYGNNHNGHGNSTHSRKKESFWSELFD